MRTGQRAGMRGASRPLLSVCLCSFFSSTPFSLEKFQNFGHIFVQMNWLFARSLSGSCIDTHLSALVFPLLFFPLLFSLSFFPLIKQSNAHYINIPARRVHVFDPAIVFLSTHWWSQHPACQRCFYKPLRNCHPSQQISTPPVEILTL